MKMTEEQIRMQEQQRRLQHLFWDCDDPKTESNEEVYGEACERPSCLEMIDFAEKHGIHRKCAEQWIYYVDHILQWRNPITFRRIYRWQFYLLRYNKYRFYLDPLPEVDYEPNIDFFKSYNEEDWKPCAEHCKYYSEFPFNCKCRYTVPPTKLIWPTKVEDCPSFEPKENER